MVVRGLRFLRRLPGKRRYVGILCLLVLLAAAPIAFAVVTTLEYFPNRNGTVSYFTPNAIAYSDYDHCISGAPWTIERVDFQKLVNDYGRAVAQTPAGGWLASANDNNRVTTAVVNPQYYSTGKRGFVQNSGVSTYRGVGDINGDNGSGQHCVSPMAREPMGRVASAAASRYRRAGLASSSAEQPAAFERPENAADAPPADSLVADPTLALARDQTRRVGVWPRGAGTAALYLSRSPVTGLTCLYLSSDAGGSAAGGCNLTSDFFSGRSVVWTSGTVGGPATSSMTALDVAGVAADRVASVVVIDSQGNRHPLSLTSDRGFIYQTPSADLGQGARPTDIATYSVTGAQLEDVQIR